MAGETRMIELRLSEDLLQKVEQRLAEIGCESLGEYVEQLIVDDAAAPMIDADLEATLVQAMSEPGCDLSEIDWESKKARLIEEFGRSRKGA